MYYLLQQLASVVLCNSVNVDLTLSPRISNNYNNIICKTMQYLDADFYKLYMRHSNYFMTGNKITNKYCICEFNIVAYVNHPIWRLQCNRLKNMILVCIIN